MRSVHAVISGRVQGVGYRAWVEREAAARGLSGWVRNRRDGTVEAVFCGDDAGVRDMLAACEIGPPMAGVLKLDVADASDTSGSGFEVRPTA